MPSYDVVVVGAGPNGLVAANVLADHGLSVCVLEAAHRPGGAVASDRHLHPAYVTDLFSAFYPFAAASPHLTALALPGWGLRWSRSPSVLSHVLPDGTAVTLHDDVGATAASVERFGAGDGERWMRQYETWLAAGDGLLRSLLGPFPPLAGPIRLVRRAGIPRALRLARLAAAGADEWAEEEFVGDGARLLVLGNTLHADIPTTGAGSAALGWVLAMAGQQYGFPVPTGGADVLVDALVRRLRARGGTVRCDARVVRVCVREGRATGVELADGATVTSDDVVATVTAPALYRELVGLGEVPAGLRRDLERFRWDHGTVKVNYALGARVPWREPAVGGSGTVHLAGDRAAVSAASQALSRGALPTVPFVIVGQMTTADVTRSPVGTESVWAYTHVPHGSPDDVVACAARRIDEAIEAQAPGFADRILARSVQTPADLERADANLVGGAINGGTALLSQQLIFRPTPGTGRPETVVDRLYLGGSSAHPGGGVHGAPGALAARAVIARRRAMLGAGAALLPRVQRALATW